jgi:hypothetical protein
MKLEVEFGEYAAFAVLVIAIAAVIITAIICKA